MTNVTNVTNLTNRAITRTIEQVLRDGARLRMAMLKQVDDIAKSARVVADALLRGNKVLIFGNGGSAADAQHIAAELVGRFVMERAPLPGIALTVDTSALTAIGNDYGFEEIFARQVRGLGNKGDVAIAITTSGKSPNVVRAAQAARERGMYVVGLTGKKGEDFVRSCDAGVAVRATNTARVQELHLTVGHLICEIVDLMVADRDAAGESTSNVVTNVANVTSTGAATTTTSGKVVDLDTLLALREAWRADGRTVVWTNGVFDILHSGHLSSLNAARTHGDIFVVGINADATVKRSKGTDRPIFAADERAAMLAALEVVDYVVVFDEDTPSEILSKVRPDVHCKGADYAPPNGLPMPEADVVRGYGGRVEFLPIIPQRSTTSTLDRLLGNRQSS